MHESCVLLSPRLHEEVIEVLIVSICKQLCEERKLFFQRVRGRSQACCAGPSSSKQALCVRHV